MVDLKSVVFKVGKEHSIKRACFMSKQFSCSNKGAVIIQIAIVRGSDCF